MDKDSDWVSECFRSGISSSVLPWKKSHCMIFVVPTVCSYFTLATSLITWQTFQQRVQSGLDLTRSTTDPFRVTSVCRRPSLRNMSMTVSIGVWSVTVIGACNATVWCQFRFNKNTLSIFLAPSLWAVPLNVSDRQCTQCVSFFISCLMSNVYCRHASDCQASIVQFLMRSWVTSRKPESLTWFDHSEQMGTTEMLHCWHLNWDKCACC